METTIISAIENAKALVRDAATYEYELYMASCLNHGIEGWFESYIASDEFSKLSPLHKKEAFAAYKGLKWFLDSLVHNYDVGKTAELLRQDEF